MSKTKKFKRPSAGGGWPALFYSFKKGREVGGLLKLYKALRTKNACKTCALGMGGQKGGMVNESGHFPSVCKKSMQAMAADMQGAIPEDFFRRFSLETLKTFTPKQLESAGRITHPLYAGANDSHYQIISWQQAYEKLSSRLTATLPDESFFYFSGRSSNEAGFLLQLFARLYGTNNVNNCSYYCHQASGVGLTSITGSGTATLTLDDLHQSDLLFLIGANPASNHPRLIHSMVKLRRKGGKVIVINPLREVGLERFKIPSEPISMLLGSKVSDEYIQPHIGGDIALMTGIAKTLLDRGNIDQDFIDQNTQGWDSFKQTIQQSNWQEIESSSGINRKDIEHLATLYSQADKVIFAWAMGITHHDHGVENVQMIGNLALMRGMLGKPAAGLMPIRGHSNVQGIGSVGVTPRLKDAIFDRLQNEFNVTLPTSSGLDTLACMEKAYQDHMRFALCLGGNLYGANPDSQFARAALEKIDLVTYLSTTLNTGHISGRGKETLVLPVLARDEERQTTTQESMFNYVRLSDGGPSRFDQIPSEVELITSMAHDVLKNTTPIDWQKFNEHDSIRQAISKCIPGFSEIAQIDQTKKEFYIDDRIFHRPKFNTESGRANFHAVQMPSLKKNQDQFSLMTIRSEGQFNTVVYEEEDFYRGQERRDIIMMNHQDRVKLGLEIDQKVTVSNPTGKLDNILVREFDIPAGNVAMYYPESNILVPKHSDPSSMTPAFKNIPVTIEAK